MSYEGGLGSLVSEIRQASANIAEAGGRTAKRFEAIEKSVDELYLKANRPGGLGASDNADYERKSAIEMWRTRRNLTIPKIDAGVADHYTPSSNEIDEALVARKALKSLFRTGEARLDHLEKKSLSSFSFGNNGFLLAPEMSNRVLSCLVSPTDVSGLVDHVTISAGSVRFFIDNARMGLGGWACEASCFVNNPAPDLQEGLGTLEIRAETLRFVTCATSDLLQDSSFDIESWLFRKIAEGFRITINNAILLGDGIGKPMGLLSPQSGIPICDVSPLTPPGQFSWQDLVQLKFELPQQWWDGSAYFMNQRTAGLLMTMSGVDGRPLLSSLPTGMPAFVLAGSPIVIVSQMPVSARARCRFCSAIRRPLIRSSTARRRRS